MFEKWTHIYPPSFLPCSFSFFWFLIRSTDLGDYIYMYTLRAHDRNRLPNPRTLPCVQFLHRFLAFCLLFSVSIGLAFDRVELFLAAWSVRPSEQNRLPFTQEASHMHTRMHTAYAYMVLMPTYLPFRGITYISEIKFGFVGFIAVTLPKRFESRADSTCPLGHFKIL